MQKSVETENIDINSVTVIPSVYENLVKGIISQNYKKFWSEDNKINIEVQNKSLEETYSILTNDQHLNTLSRQIHFSECLEVLSGIFVDEKVRMYRGFLLNLEKINLLFNLYKRIADIYDIEALFEASSVGLNNNTNTFIDLWGNSYPHKMVRPGCIEKEINEDSIRKTLQMLINNRKLIKRIRKIVRGSKPLKETLENYYALSEFEIVKTGLTGPLARSINIVTPLINASTSANHFSSSEYSQFATSEASNPIGILEICNVELKLASERMIQLLQKIHGRTTKIEPKLKNGRISYSFSKSLGINHLTVEIERGLTKYLKFVPFEVSNLFGISRLITLNSPSLYDFILLFLNPEIEIRFST